MLLNFLTRLPVTAMGITLTLHIVTDLGRGYGAAGLVGTATTIGSAVGAPVLGRLIDRHGLRPVVAGCGLASGLFWMSTPHLPYLVLLVVALPAGALAIPIGSIARQVLAALVPTDLRRTAYSLDTIVVETSFMVGPAVGILVSTQISGTVALTGIGVCFLVSAGLLCWVNPPIRTEHEVVTGPRPATRTWLTGKIVATLLIAAGAGFTLMGMELSMLAALRETGAVDWAGILFVVICAASALGGLVHGAVRRSLPQLWLMALMAALLVPVGLFTDPWWVLALALIPMNLLCAPTLAATSESVVAMTPVRVRGEAMGMQDSAVRLGLALGSPAAGFVIDHSAAGWGFVASGGVGVAVAAVALLLTRQGARQPTTV
ncbi:MFS transporter [Amycolatopsis suaedae]|uniref:MFS transporter n=1 Tax=Amycolatopsis suaedae TaxID=2510978 RepID=A0A4Q7JEF4_9PSEU|nr:MFS transporter [Amycolatopsis suaedae]RZQ65486.1 MFS transporter [Amycolatopsis suaedae]